MSQSIPNWLAVSHSQDQLIRIFRILRERESDRDRARIASRQQAQSTSNRPSRSTRYLASLRFIKQPSQESVGHYAVQAGTEYQNEDKNRYIELEPYDRTRVIVGGEHEGITIGNDPEFQDQVVRRYLNASWVLERFGHKWWIAAQAPLPNTAHAFLSVMLLPISQSPTALKTVSQSRKTCRVRTVVQLTQNVESGRRKAHAYFPTDIGRSLIVPPEVGCSSPPLKVTLLDVREHRKAHCLQSTVSIVPILNTPHVLRAASAYDKDLEVDEHADNYGDEDESAKVIFQHMLYTSWPDHGIPEPEDRTSLLEFTKLVDKTNRDLSLFSHPDPSSLDPDPPIMAGCSAGIGRTGTFIALSSLLRDLGFLPPAVSPTLPSVLHEPPIGPLPEDLKEDKVSLEVDSLREQRPGMVQREEQLLLIYEVLVGAYADSQQT